MFLSGSKVSTFTYSDQGAKLTGNRVLSADISNVVKWAMTDPVMHQNNAPVIALGQLNWSTNAHLVGTAQGQGRYSRDRH